VIELKFHLPTYQVESKTESIMLPSSVPQLL